MANDLVGSLNATGRDALMRAAANGGGGEGGAGSPEFSAGGTPNFNESDGAFTFDSTGNRETGDSRESTNYGNVSPEQRKAITDRATTAEQARAAEEAAGSATEPRDALQNNADDPRGSLENKGLLQEAVEVEVKANEILDPIKHNAEATKVAPVAVAVTSLTDTPELGEAMKAASAQLPPAEQVEIASQLAIANGTAGANATVGDVMVTNYDASLLTPEDMARNLKMLKKEDPMAAASMADEMEALLAGMENGEIPMWARPAVTKVEQQLAARGLSASSIGRDSLFNAIITSAMPIAQQDATFKQQANKTNYDSKIAAIFSDTAAINAAKQFNATSENQQKQFMAQLQTNVDMQNAARSDTRAAFNATQVNEASKLQASLDQQAELTNVAAANDFMKTQVSLETQVSMANTTATNQMEQFNTSQANELTKFAANMDQQRVLFNSQQSAAIEQSNVSWRRQTNQINTAIQNQVNQTNVGNAFNLSNQALSFLWQEERDQAQWEFQADESSLDRRNRLEANVIANETAAAGEVGSWVANITEGLNLLDKIFD